VASFNLRFGLTIWIQRAGALGEDHAEGDEESPDREPPSGRFGFQEKDGLEDAADRDEKAVGGEQGDGEKSREMIPDAEGGGRDESEPEGGDDDGEVEHLRKGVQGSCANPREAKAADEEGEAGGIDGGHGGLEMREDDEGEGAAAGRGDHVDGAEDGIARPCSRLVNGEGDANASQDEPEPLQ